MGCSFQTPLLELLQVPAQLLHLVHLGVAGEHQQVPALGHLDRTDAFSSERREQSWTDAGGHRVEAVGGGVHAALGVGGGAEVTPGVSGHGVEAVGVHAALGEGGGAEATDMPAQSGAGGGHLGGGEDPAAALALRNSTSDCPTFRMKWNPK